MAVVSAGTVIWPVFSSIVNLILTRASGSAEDRVELVRRSIDYQNSAEPKPMLAGNAERTTVSA